ncbi:MAG: agmatine deiminase family protein [Pseudomonadota bacterium]
MDETTEKELIVLFAPRSDDEYYRTQRADIVRFQIDYARAISAHDDVLVFTDAASFGDYTASLGESRVVIAPQEDIWARDVGLASVLRPVLFRYTAAGQGGGANGAADARYVQSALRRVIDEAGLSYAASSDFNDGGNLVDDDNERAIASRKFLRDNNLTEAEARQRFEQLGFASAAFIEADEQGGLEHADGVVAFIAANTVVINDYPDDRDYAEQLRADLTRAFPDLTIHTLVAPHTERDTYDDRFGSACGLYTNMLVTPLRIYLPQFGLPEDRIALSALRGWTNKQVIGVPSAGVCGMGGGVRCLSWQLRGENARRLKDWARSQRSN